MAIDMQGLAWARRFHETYERLAPQFGYETRPDTRQFESESKNGQLMIAVCGELIREAEHAAYRSGFAECQRQVARICLQYWDEQSKKIADATFELALPAAPTRGGGVEGSGI